ncbi:MAG: enoyl-CoA hydratase/isomerase family protein [Planctomycetaceae bacterium]|nr:enoyl-CoA hydratase/isomerase family protein [Planctomycetaceae bacterium]
MSDLVRVETLLPGMTRLVLNRPERRNALSIALVTQLCDTIERLASDAAQRVIVLGAEGPVFCSGLDLKEAADDALVERSAVCIERLFRTLRETPLVSIAAARGGAYAGGGGLLAACDMAIATNDFQIGFPEARRGLLPALIFAVVQSRVSEGDLRELFLVGDPVDANRALQMGLLQRVVSGDQLELEATRIGRSILAGGPETIRKTKRLINAAFDALQSDHDDAARSSHLDARRSAEAIEGMAAFREKRRPWWDQGEA